MILSGIYVIINSATGKIYVGSAVNFQKRWWVHSCRLRANEHDNPKLQAAWNAYGEDCFEFRILEIIADKSKLIEREQWWLDWIDCCNVGYNILKAAGNSLGYKHTEEFKKNRSELYKGRKQSPELIERRIAPLRGKPLSEETKKKLSNAKLGNKSRLGQPHTETTKLKISLTKQLKRDMAISPLSLENEIKWRK